jgi:uncharacterized glyoxalase superfamily metalloenzyme YdcJ
MRTMQSAFLFCQQIQKRYLCRASFSWVEDRGRAIARPRSAKKKYMETLVQIAAAAFFIIYTVKEFTAMRQISEIEKTLNKFIMSNTEYNEQLLAKVSAIQAAIDIEHLQISEKLAEMEQAIEDLRVSLEDATGDPTERIAILNSLDGLVAGVRNIYEPPVEEEEEDDETEDEEGQG